jgi:hypothetical protein
MRVMLYHKLAKCNTILLAGRRYKYLAISISQKGGTSNSSWRLKNTRFPCSEFMKSLSTLLHEAAASKPLTRVTLSELSAILGKARLQAMQKHLWYRRHCPPDMKVAYKHGTDRLGYHEVEVYPYDSDKDRMEDGKIRPTKMIRFEFANAPSYRVTNAHLFTRPTLHNDNWIYKESYIKDE